MGEGGARPGGPRLRIAPTLGGLGRCIVLALAYAALLPGGAAELVGSPTASPSPPPPPPPLAPVDASAWGHGKAINCTGPGLNEHCSFHRMVCLDATLTARPRRWWTDSEPPFPGWGGVQLVPQRMGHNAVGDWGGCDDPFLPARAPAPAPPAGAGRFPGTAVYACTWTHHFGHVLVDMLYPTFEALRAQQALSPNATGGSAHDAPAPGRVVLVLDPHIRTEFGSVAAAVGLFRLLAPVVGASGLVRRARHANQSAVCFERLVAGVKRHGLSGPGSADVPPGGYQALRDYVLARHGAAPPAPGACSAVLLTRRGRRAYSGGPHGRQLSNLRAVEAVLAEVLGPGCGVRGVALDDHGAPMDQVRLVAGATWLVSVSGTGSHQMMWLPDGGVSLVIEAPLHPDVNKGRPICDASAGRVLCLRSPATMDPLPPQLARLPGHIAGMQANVTALLPELRAQVEAGLAWQAEWRRQRQETGGGGSGGASGLGR